MSDIMNEYADVCAERDTAQMNLIYAKEEIDRLKAELEKSVVLNLTDEAFKDRDLWKSMAQNLAEMLEKVHQMLIPGGADCMPGCGVAKVLAEFKKNNV